MTIAIRRRWLAWLSHVALLVPAMAHAEGLLLLDNPAAIGDARSAYAVVEGFQGSDALAVRQYLSDWQGAYTPGAGNNIGIMAARSEAGMQWNGFRLGALYRAQALAETNRDTTDLVRAYNTSSGYDTGRTYTMDYHLTGFAATGVRLGKRLQWDVSPDWSLRWGLAGALLNGTQLKLESASGQAQAVTAQDFNANAVMTSSNSNLDTRDTSLFNPFVQATGGFAGQGYALDTGVLLQRSDGLQLELSINDVVGQIDWKNVPVRETRYNNANKSYDAAGYVHYSATASATSNYSSITQTLDPKLWLALNYPLGRYQAQVGTSYVGDVWLPEVNLGLALSDTWRIKTGYDLRFGTVVLAIQHPRFEMSVRTDQLDLAQAKAYGLRLAFNLPL